MFHHCHRCNKSLSAFRQKCPNCGVELFDSWLHRGLTWLGHLAVVGLVLGLLGTLASTFDTRPEIAWAFSCGLLLVHFQALRNQRRADRCHQQRMELLEFHVANLSRQIETERAKNSQCGDKVAIFR